LVSAAMSGSGPFQRKRQRGSGEAGDPHVLDSSSDREGPDTETTKMLTGLKRHKQKHVDGSLNTSMGTELLRTIQLHERELATQKQETEVAKQQLVANKLHEQAREMRMKRDQDEIKHLRKELAAHTKHVKELQIQNGEHQKQLCANERTLADAKQVYQHEKARLENAVAAQTETNNNLKKELQASKAQITTLEEQLSKNTASHGRLAERRLARYDSSDKGAHPNDYNAAQNTEPPPQRHKDVVPDLDSSDEEDANKPPECSPTRKKASHNEEDPLGAAEKCSIGTRDERLLPEVLELPGSPNTKQFVDLYLRTLDQLTSSKVVKFEKTTPTELWNFIQKRGQYLWILSCGLTACFQGSSKQGIRVVITVTPNAAPLSCNIRDVLKSLRKNKRYPCGKLPTTVREALFELLEEMEIPHCKKSWNLSCAVYIPLELDEENTELTAFTTALMWSIVNQATLSPHQQYEWKSGFPEKQKYLQFLLKIVQPSSSPQPSSSTACYDKGAILGLNTDLPNHVELWPCLKKNADSETKQAYDKMCNILNTMCYRVQQKECYYPHKGPTIISYEKYEHEIRFYLDNGTRVGPVLNKFFENWKTEMEENGLVSTTICNQTIQAAYCGAFYKVDGRNVSREQAREEIHAFFLKIKRGTGAVVSIALEDDKRFHAFAVFRGDDGRYLFTDAWHTAETFDDLFIAKILTELDIEYAYEQEYGNPQSKEPSCVLIALMLLAERAWRKQFKILNDLFNENRMLCTMVQDTFAYLVAHWGVVGSAINDHVTRVTDNPQKGSTNKGSTKKGSTTKGSKKKGHATKRK